MRWFGPEDPVSLQDILQSGATNVVTALHHIAPGEVWTIDEISKRKSIVEATGLTWEVVESLPVSETIKQRNDDWQRCIDQYKSSLKNLAACGIKVVTYNFMPVFDWVRSDMSFALPNGAKSLYFNKKAVAAFDLFLLQRPNAEQDYTKEELIAIRAYFDALSASEKETLFNNILLGLPGNKEQLKIEDVRQAIALYANMTTEMYRENLLVFLREVIPVAVSCGIRMAIHPDDPPFSLFGLPRVVSTEADLLRIVNAVPVPENGICFCSGSLGVRPENDLIFLLKKFRQYIPFVHLRNVQCLPQGDFYEAEHLNGSSDMYALVREIVELMQANQQSVYMRPDHGHQMLHDLQNQTYPGYSAIGRLKALAELRGLEIAVSRSW